MKNLLFSGILLGSIMITSCSTSPECCAEPSSLIGTWQQYEYGYSPGAGYVTEEVPDSPLKYIEIMTDYGFESNIEGLEGFHFYRLTKDSLSDHHILSLYMTDPARTDEASQQNYNMELTSEGNLKLYFRFCIEGCHMAFRPYLARSK